MRRVRRNSSMGMVQIWFRARKSCISSLGRPLREPMTLERVRQNEERPEEGNLLAGAVTTRRNARVFSGSNGVGCMLARSSGSGMPTKCAKSDI